MRECGILQLSAYVGPTHHRRGAVQFARQERVTALEGKGPGSIECLSEHDVANLLRDLSRENAKECCTRTTHVRRVSRADGQHSRRRGQLAWYKLLSRITLPISPRWSTGRNG